MGTGSRVASIFLRVFELISAAIVAGLVGEYLHYVSDAHQHAEPKLVYTVALAGISLVVCLFCMIPFNFAFYGFVLDFILFVMWMTSFGLLVNLTGSGGCHSSWYWNSWGYYWGRWYVHPVPNLSQSIVGTAACGKWRATQAWSFIGGWFWLVSSFLGAYVVFRIRDERPVENRQAGMFGHKKVLSKDETNGSHTQNGVQETREVQNGDHVNNV